MTDEDLEIWKEKTKGIYHITEYRRFWNYIENLKKREQALFLLLNWAEECDWGFDNFRDDDAVNWNNFEKESEDLGYVESMIKYAEMYLEKKKIDD